MLFVLIYSACVAFAGSNGSGGGLLVYHTDNSTRSAQPVGPVFINLTAFSHQTGSALYIYASKQPVNITIQSSAFDSNNADHGAAVRLTLSGDKSSSDSGATGPLVSFEDCLFTNNTADFTGGAIGTCNSSWHVSQ